MYKFVKDLMQLKCQPLQVHEIDLTAKNELASKLELEEPDVRPNFSNEILEKGMSSFLFFEIKPVEHPYAGHYTS